jgi:hypothetical protein
VVDVQVSSFYRWKQLLGMMKTSGDERRQRKLGLMPVGDADAGPSTGFVPVKISPHVVEMDVVPLPAQSLQVADVLPELCNVYEGLTGGEVETISQSTTRRTQSRFFE